jgi:hypothetical protein
MKLRGSEKDADQRADQLGNRVRSKSALTANIGSKRPKSILERGKRLKKLNVLAQITGFLSFRLQIPGGRMAMFAKAWLDPMTPSRI